LYAEAQGLPVVGQHVEAQSAKDMNRPVLLAAIESLEPGQVLLALNLGRITRSVRDLDAITEMIADKGAAWETVEDAFETRTAMGRAMLRIVAVLSQLEREQIGERTSHALRAKQDRGEHVGAVPTGYKRVGQLLATDEGSAAVLDRIQSMRNSGASYRKIAKTLNAEGILTVRGGAWSEGTVWKVASRQEGGD